MQRKFPELDSLIELNVQEIKDLLSAITAEEINEPDKLKGKLDDECEDRWNKVYTFIQDNYPIGEMKIGDSGCLIVPRCNNVNFLAQCHLNKYSRKFESLCYEWFLENVKGYFQDGNKHYNELPKQV